MEPSTQQSHTQQFNIHHFWSILLKRKYVALAVALVIISIFTWGSLLFPKTYQAESIVAIEGESIIDPLI